MAELRWKVLVDTQTLPGDYPAEKVLDLIKEYKGKKVLVWREGMTQWADPGQLPEFKTAQPAPQPIVTFGQVKLDKGEIKKKAGFFKVLFDFRFEHFITTKIIPVLYVVMMVVIGLVALGYLFIGAGGMILTAIRRESFVPMLLAFLIVLLVPVATVIYLSLVRIGFEIAIVFFRIKEDLALIVENTRKETPRNQ